MVITRSKWVFLGIFVVLDILVFSQKQTFFQHLKTLPELEITIMAEVDSLITNKMKPYENQGEITVTSGSESFSLPVKLTVRGKFRRRVCDLPPLELNLPKGKLKDLGFKKADKYKLVTHCLNTGSAILYLKREYLIYQLYQRLDSMSYGAVLFPVKYIDQSSGAEIKSYAMILESHEELEDRLDEDWCDCMGIQVDSIEPYHYELVNFFQFMVGNNDMNMMIEHNVRFVEGKSGPGKIPIPYDFDFSSFVGAPYAHPGLSISDLRHSIRKGHNKMAFEDVKTVFVNKKDDFLKVIESFDLLPKGQRKKSKRFISKFYKVIDARLFEEYYFDHKTSE